MEDFEKYIHENLKLSDELIKKLLSSMVIQTIQKKEYLITPGKAGDFIAFVNSGVLRYFIGKDGSEYNIGSAELYFQK